MKGIKKILLVDDDIDFLEEVVSIFEIDCPELEILQTSNVKTAKEIIEIEYPDLLITDWEMPFESGLELISFVRKTKQIKHIPIILCTGKMTNMNNLQTAFKYGVNDFIRKPVDKIELISRVRAMLMLVDSIMKNIEQKRKIQKFRYKLIDEKLQHLETSFAKKLEEIQKADLDLQTKKLKIKEIEELSKVFNLKKCSSCANFENKSLQFEKDTNGVSFDYEDIFFKKLIEICPDLTPSEIKLAFLIKMTYSSKQIAELLYIQSSSVNIARYRIRKKLALGKTDNLETYLQFL